MSTREWTQIGYKEGSILSAVPALHFLITSSLLNFSDNITWKTKCTEVSTKIFSSKWARKETNQIFFIYLLNQKLILFRVRDIVQKFGACVLHTIPDSMPAPHVSSDATKNDSPPQFEKKNDQNAFLAIEFRKDKL